jgi:hypothetical protein
VLKQLFVAIEVCSRGSEGFGLPKEHGIDDPLKGIFTLNPHLLRVTDSGMSELTGMAVRHIGANVLGVRDNVANDVSAPTPFILPRNGSIIEKLRYFSRRQTVYDV